MPSSEHRRPAYTAADAARIAEERFGLAGLRVTELPSDRDQNFRLTATGRGPGMNASSADAGHGRTTDWVLKFSNGAEDPDFLDLQVRVLEHLKARSASIAEAAGVPGDPFPTLVPDASGRFFAPAPGPGGDSHLVRLVTWIDGVPLVQVVPRTPALARRLGRLLGATDRALLDFSHPAASRPFPWDLTRAPSEIAERLECVEDPVRRARLERWLRAVDRDLPEQRKKRLRRSVIHNDANDHNVLVSRLRPGAILDERVVTGLIDFGDLVESWTAADVAVALAYAMMDAPDPLATAAALVGGYNATLPLEEEELAAIGPLVRLRLCLSLAMSAFQRAREPENDYLSVSELGAWGLLEHLDSVHPDLFHYVLRDACGLEPCPRTPAIVQWLEGMRSAGRIASIVQPDLARDPTLTFDLTVGSPEMGVTPDPRDTAAWTAEMFGRLRASGAVAGIGRYDEARRWYTSLLFQGEGDGEWRTIHIGVDVFMEPGTTVHAPLDGFVHSFRDNAAGLDYGPTIILRHPTTEDGPDLYTLYGHLTRDSLAGLEEGTAVTGGQEIARIGDFPENGDWVPHLHFQLVTNLLGRSGDFPGVATPSRRSVWLSLCPDPNLVLGIPEGVRAPRPPAPDELLAARTASLGPSLSVSYRRPLEIVRGAGAYLYDHEGRAYLDCVNNVAHVGHGHPTVVEAARRQIAVLNTNTRYLHEHLVEYARRLAATLPPPLSVCFFVCSGSEANELALRMARTFTGRRDVVVVDGAYHGNTTALVEISPYKFAGPGGEGAPPHVHVVPTPDAYRGVHRRGEPGLGERYASHLDRALDRAGERGGAAAFFCESLLSCAGQIVLPDGYLAAAYDRVGAAGGVTVADEVQVGFGRVGSHFWGFETQGVFPDIVTMGKPIGNGHPLAAVVTTREIAEAFDNGMEYFNTFGGNPVSCAVGLAVLDAIEADGLQRRALEVGGHFRTRLEELAGTHLLIGDVRGLGLFLGIELVRDRESLEPAGEEAAALVERMRDHGILLSTDGPHHNVIKIKPPLVFSREDADRVVDTLDRVLREDAFRVRS